MTLDEQTIHHNRPEEAAPAEIRCVVGIGASAGGIKSLETLLSGLPPHTGMVFVVVQHLSPHFRSLMDEVLARFTSLPVINSADGMLLEPDKIYLITPRNNIAIRDGRFSLTEMDPQEIQRPVDVLLKSLAHGFGRRAVGVILSGTGTDGVHGIQDIHESGGLTIAESPEEAQFDGMPVNAIATDCVDFVLSTAEIARLLSKHAENPTEKPAPQAMLTEEQLSGIKLVFSLLCDRHGIDFADYKAATVARRIDRRIRACNCHSMEDYAERLRHDNAEIDLLYHDLLIGVTKFFRDSEAFFALQTQLQRMVARLQPGEELRMWVAGCATGEEAYTLAMLAVEAFDRVKREVNLKILATDVHQGALDAAARGVFSAESLEFVTHQRQGRFFTPVDNGRFRVTSELRRHIIFARHNVIQDPPFTRMSIVTCRNLLIYLQPRSQTMAIASFHFALEADGLMMLGSSETPGKLQDEFATIDRTWRLYRKLRSLPNLLTEAHNLTANVVQPPRRLVNILNRDKPEQLSFTGLLEAYDLLLREFIECGLLLDEKRNVLHVFGDAHKYLRSASGRFTGNVMRLLEGEARTNVGAALVRALKEPATRLVIRNVHLETDDATHEVDISVKALQSAIAGGYVWFVEFAGSDTPRIPVQEEIRITRSGDDYDALEAELAYSRQSLSATIEELEASNEELQATNEELTAANEELQSTNQELHSVNEELYSVNSENHRKITELQEVSEDIENLLSSTDIGTVFVDAEVRIRKFTIAATRYFNLVDHDIGRPLTNFTHALAMPDLLDQIQDVINTGDPVVHETNTKRGEEVLVKIVPYISGTAQKGAIMNILDINLLRTGRSQAESSEPAQDEDYA